MEHAGAAVAQRALPYLKNRPGPVGIFSGGGANGGDGLVAARHLDNWGIPVRVVLASDPKKMRGACRTNLQILRRLKVPFETVQTVSAWHRWVKRGSSLSLVVDALLGTGVSGPVREPIRSVILWINRQHRPVISVDLPSGLSSDTGLPCGIVVRATETVTCGLPKVGLKKGQGPSLSGRVTVADISLPRLLRTGVLKKKIR